MDPATAVALTLSGIATVSGYGAMKLNAKSKATIDEQVKLAIGDAEALIKSAQDATLKAEKERNKQDEEVKRLNAELSTLKKAQKQLLDQKKVLSQNLESATELEKTYRELTPEVFKQAIMDFKENIVIKKLGHEEFFDPLLSRFSVTRGTARSLYTKFEKAVAKNVMISQDDFNAFLLEYLKNGKTSLEERQKKEAAEAQAAKDKAVEAKTAKDEADKQKANEAQALRQLEAEQATAKRKADQETAMTNAKVKLDARNAAIEKAAKDKAAGEVFVKNAALEAQAAKDKIAQEKGVLTLRTPKGGMRKKKLRTRRRDKQNVRRTRRSQNRPNRTDTYSSRRSEIDASGDELGL